MQPMNHNMMIQTVQQMRCQTCTNHSGIILRKQSNCNCNSQGKIMSHVQLQFDMKKYDILNLQKKYEFNFFVIADVDPKPNLKNYTFIKWNKETEISDILRFHIGVMPLINDDISRGKCGFKAIQYMSLGIPAVVSPVGVNSTIIENGVNGYLCHNIEDWIKSIEILLLDSQLRETIGIQARTQIETLYSVEATTEQFINQFS
jgi:glycosyltransferase involved in cell wall biosynthesis